MSQSSAGMNGGGRGAINQQRVLWRGDACPNQSNEVPWKSYRLHKLSHEVPIHRIVGLFHIKFEHATWLGLAWSVKPHHILAYQGIVHDASSFDKRSLVGANDVRKYQAESAA